MEKPLIRPPNTQMSRMSSVTGTEGTRSVKILLTTMARQEYMVNRLPMSLKLTAAGMALSTRLMGAKGSVTPQNSWAQRWARRVRPVKPPGNRSPAWTKLL